jgi:Flp pilus assembly protein CpaB
VTIVIIIVIVLVVIAVGGALIARQTSQRRQFGPEYDQLVQEVGPRQARAEFAKRQKRVAGLDLKELSPEQRAAYEARWEAAQEQFIDNPPQATQAAAGLVRAVAAEIGYPVGDRDQLLADLSVNHGKYLDGYRAAIRATDQAAAGSTEEFRRALLDYRTLFNDLIGAQTADGARSRLPRRDQTAVEQSS